MTLSNPLRAHRPVCPGPPARPRAGAGRLGAVLALFFVVGVALFALNFGGDEAPAPQTLDERLRADDRIAPLLSPCAEGKQFTGDTGHMPAVLARKLIFSQLDPLRRSKQELADLGPAAIPELRRVFDESYSDQWKHGVLNNVLGVCALMDEPVGLEILRLGLEHPQESVRLTALDGLRKHGEPSDYDDVARWIPLSTTKENCADLLLAMQAIDPERLYADVAGWLEEGALPDVVPFVLPRCAGARAEDTVRRLRELYPKVDAPLNVYLLAPSVAQGDSEVLEQMRALLLDDNSETRRHCLEALNLVQAFEEALIVFREDDIEELRASAVSMLAQLPVSPKTEGWLVSGLSDPGQSVRSACTNVLALRGYEPVIVEALENLDGHLKQRELGLDVLRLVFDERPDIAQRAFDVVARRVRESIGGSNNESVALMQTLAHIRGRASAELLVELGSSLQGTIRGWRPYRWCVFQAYNAGPEALAYLRERFLVEEDPEARIDLLSAIWQDHSDGAREILRTALTAERSHAYELLYAADLLARIGPAVDQAPFLKREVYFRNTDARVRPALQCLLWRWYG